MRSNSQLCRTPCPHQPARDPHIILCVELRPSFQQQPHNLRIAPEDCCVQRDAVPLLKEEDSNQPAHALKLLARLAALPATLIIQDASRNPLSPSGTHLPFSP